MRTSKIIFLIVIFSVFHSRHACEAQSAKIENSEVRYKLVSSVHINRKYMCNSEISPFQYGQFIEYLADLVPGMWAEKLYDASFEGLVPYNVTFCKETDFREKPWYPIGAVHRGDYTLDNNNPFNGKVSQRIRILGDEPCTLGIAQEGIFIEKGKSYNLSVYLRQNKLVGPLWALLKAGGDWGLGRAMLWTLDNALACSRYHNLMHRYADFVEIANRSNLTNSFCSGIIQTDNSRLYKMPTYYAQQLYANHAGAYPLQVEFQGDIEQNNISATLSHDGQTVAIFVVNNKTDGNTINFDLSEFGSPKNQSVLIWTLMDTKKAGERDVTNSFDEPQRICPVASKVSVRSAVFDHTFRPLSLTVLKCELSVGHP